MLREEEEPPAGAQAAAGPPTLQEVFQSLQLSEFSDVQVTAFVDSLPQGFNKAQFRKILSYVLKFVEYNRSKYEMLRTEYRRLSELANSMRDELTTFAIMQQEQLPAVAPVPAPPPPTMATLPPLASVPTQATTLMPPASLATASQPQVSMARVQPSACCPSIWPAGNASTLWRTGAIQSSSDKPWWFHFAQNGSSG